LSHNGSRRDFVRLTLGGSVGLLASRFGLGAQEAVASGRAKACVLLWLAGGPSQVDTFDLKPELTPFKEIETTGDARICEHLPRLARQMNRVSVIRTAHSRDPNHATATYLLHTSYRKAPDLDHPHLGSLIAHELGERCDLPGCIVMGWDPQSGAGYLPGEKGPVIFDKIDSPGEDIKLAMPRDRLRKRWEILRALDERFAREREDGAVEQRRRSYERAFRVLTSEQVKAFDLSKESPDRYGNTPFGRACLTARRLVQSGVRFVEVALGDWDSHARNAETHQKLMEALDPAYAALLQDLADRRMLDETLVLCMGEFGRTPRVNGGAGRDHFTKCWSVALGGGGLAGDRLVGRTDGLEIQDRPVSVPDLFATIYSAFGIDPAKEHKVAGGRPVKIVDGGLPVKELF
jgi:uncharacterized protein (DUF1501 family)